MSKKAIIIGGGPSIKEGIEQSLWNKISNKEVWATNYQFLKIPFMPDILFWCDFPFFKRVFYHWLYKRSKPEYISKIEALIPNTKLIGGVKPHDIKEPTINKDTANLEMPVEYLYAINGVNPYFVPRERGKPEPADVEKRKLGNLPRGKRGLVGTMALSYALLKGYDEVFILGYDLGIPGKKESYKKQRHRQEGVETHFHNIDHWGQGNTDPFYLEDNLQEGRDDYDEMFSDIDMKVWNVSLNSNIDTFEKISYQEFFNKVR